MTAYQPRIEIDLIYSLNTIANAKSSYGFFMTQCQAPIGCTTLPEITINTPLSHYKKPFCSACTVLIPCFLKVNEVLRTVAESV